MAHQQMCCAHQAKCRFLMCQELFFFLLFIQSCTLFTIKCRNFCCWWNHRFRWFIIFNAQSFQSISVNCSSTKFFWNSNTKKRRKNMRDFFSDASLSCNWTPLREYVRTKRKKNKRIPKYRIQNRARFVDQQGCNKYFLCLIHINYISGCCR